MKLWEKGYSLDRLVEAFMTGDDPYLDNVLIPYDCMGSIAHAKMLTKIGVLTEDECSQLVRELHRIIERAEKGQFVIALEDEDVHTAIENALIATLGDIGKKLHTARSRNDQVSVDLRLYMKHQLLEIAQKLIEACDVLCRFADEHRHVPMVGRTHFQRAMPSSLGLWSGAFAESLLDDLHLLRGTYDLIDQCPLGAAASYGVSLPIDRQYCAELLGFTSVQNNVLYVNNSRGKFEAAVLHVCVHIMTDLSKVATDLIIFSAPEFGYLSLPEKFCPGSSLMPQKRNPDPLELIRAKSATLQGLMMQTFEVIRGLPSGYNRDFQETKRPLMQGLETTYAALAVFSRIFSEIQIDTERCTAAFTPELFATDAVLTLTASGIPFREAYRQVAERLEEVAGMDPVANIQAKKHLGATGNLGLEISRTRIEACQHWLTGNLQTWLKSQLH